MFEQGFFQTAQSLTKKALQQSAGLVKRQRKEKERVGEKERAHCSSCLSLLVLLVLRHGDTDPDEIKAATVTARTV
jgi:hypothetical protein